MTVKVVCPSHRLAVTEAVEYRLASAGEGDHLFVSSFPDRKSVV